MIHPTAIINEGAQIHPSVEIGPYSVIGGNVKIGAGTTVGPHVVIDGRTEIGEGNKIFQFASVGAIPQHLQYDGEPTELKIGNENNIREFVTIHLGTAQDKGLTKIGSRNTFMAYCHIAHDCVIADSVIMANGATLGGHVYLDSHSILGGLVGVHQFVRIGCYAMIGGLSGVSLDIPPYTRSAGFRTKLSGLNLIGLKRHGFSQESISNLRKAYRILFQSGLLLEQAVAQVQEEIEEDPQVQNLIQFMQKSERGICR